MFPTLLARTLPSLASTPVQRVAVGTIAVLATTGILALSARVQVPFYPVPMTLQTLAVFLTGICLGWRLGGIAILAYLGEGLVGFPVLASGAGPAYFLGPTGGYLAGFFVAAVIVGVASDRGWGRNLGLSSVTICVATVLLFGLGVGWLSSSIGLEKAVAVGFLPFIWGAVFKGGIAVLAWFAMEQYVRRAKGSSGSSASE